MKKKTKIILLSIASTVLVCTIGGVAAFQIIRGNLDRLSASVIETVPMDKVADGVYVGEYGVFPVLATVEVTVRDHQIASARILKHQNGQGSAGEAVVDRAVKANSLQVDTAAGATYSSKVLLKAMGDALRKGITP